jgi:hypothetical protein
MEIEYEVYLSSNEKHWLGQLCSKFPVREKEIIRCGNTAYVINRIEYVTRSDSFYSSTSIYLAWLYVTPYTV